MHVGIGYDAHRLTEGRRLVLGGVEVPSPKGLDGWSDADVLTHAIIDALLGAAGLGDIGSHFPPGDPQYKDISSLELLRRVRSELVDNNWRTGNIDATIIAERPHLRGFIDLMRRRLCEALAMDVCQVSIKATTSEGLGYTGREEGIAAMVVALLEEVEPDEE